MARVYAITDGGRKGSLSYSVKGQVYLDSHSVTVLFDCGATHTFVAIRMLDRLRESPSPLEKPLPNILPSEDMIYSDGHQLYIGIIGMEIPDFDLILGMDFLYKYGAVIDCK